MLTNALAHVAGVAAFSFFLWLLARNRSSEALAPAGAAGLALFWNLGSLVVLLAGPEGPVSDVVASLSFAVLSLLPCVLLHLALGRDFPALLYLGYAVGTIAAVAHLSETFGLQIASHEFGIRLITYGFSGLAVASAVLLRRAAAMRALAALSLFLLAASFVHFGAEHGPGSWAHEIVFHHAGIPLALFVLLQDFRFLLLDVFVRIAGAAVLAAAFAAGLLVVAQTLGLLAGEPADALALAMFLTATCGAILVFPWLRDRLRRWAEATLFRRGDFDSARAAIRSLGPLPDDEFFSKTAAVLASYTSARRSSVGKSAESWAQVSIELPERAGTTRVLSLGQRAGGRRYLSDDIADLNRLAAEAADRLDHLRREEQRRLLAEAQLEALRAQINPHFLFNALNALYGIIPRSAADARKTLVNLSEVFRYSLEGKRQLVSLEEELKIVEAYLQIERLRFGERLVTEVDVDESLMSLQVPALSVQPLVENAVKHGISANAEGGAVRVSAEKNAVGAARIRVTDDGPGFAVDGAELGHGLDNVRRRLELCYGSDVRLSLESSSSGTVAAFDVPN